MDILRSIPRCHMDKKEKPKSMEFKLTLVTVLRITSLVGIVAAYQHAATIQLFINELWLWLKEKWWYKSVYNETVYVELYSFPAMLPYRIMHIYNIGSQYRINGNTASYESFPTYTAILVHAFEYAWPFALLDTFHVKQYAGVSDSVLKEKYQDWIQVTRPLPEDPPLLRDMVRHLVLAFIIYDFLFFLQHYLFHKNATLYKIFHKEHHTHDSVNVKVANHMHVIERVILILCANAGLRIQGAHPLTRSVFIPIFLSYLLDNHSGYDFPWSYDKILPRGLVGGSLRHNEHHAYGKRYYQPIFTYMDNFIEWYNDKRNRKKK